MHKSVHDEVNGGIFFFSIFLYILEKINIIAYFNYENAKSACFMLYFVIIHFITVQKY